MTMFSSIMDGVLFVDRLIEMVGPCPGCWRLRASFHEAAGDLAAAVADLERELARTAEDDYRHGSIQRTLSAYRARLADGDE